MISCLAIPAAWAALGALPVAAQVNLPEGFELVEFGVSEFLTGAPTINECGQVVFTKGLADDPTPGEVYLYDNGRTIQITFDNHHDAGAVINNAGTMGWSRGPDRSGTRQVIVYQDGVETIIDDHRTGVGGSSINNLGHVMWTRWGENNCPYRDHIFVWDGRRIWQVDENDDSSNQAWRGFNDVGDFVWTHYNFCAAPWVSTILHRQNRRIEALPTASTQSQHIQMNNRRQAVWAAVQGLEFWESGRTELLLDGGRAPALNDHGDIYFVLWDSDRRVHSPWVSYDLGNDRSWHRLVEDYRWFGAGDINDWGETVTTWLESVQNFGGGVLLLRRVRTGDTEFNGSIGLSDYRRMAECLTGPDWDELVQRGPDETLCECRFLDLDYDGDVDLGDFACFQTAYMGE